MALQTVTLQLPENIYQRLRRMAETTRQPLEEVVFHSIQGILPPVTDDLPIEMQNELATLQNLSDDTIVSIMLVTLSSVCDGSPLSRTNASIVCVHDLSVESPNALGASAIPVHVTTAAHFGADSRTA